MVGKTVSHVTKYPHRHCENVMIHFTDGDAIVIMGGGMDGYGDYCRVMDEFDA